MPSPATRTSQMTLRVVQPSLFYACALTSTPISYLTETRRIVLGATWGKHLHRRHFLTPPFGTDSMVEPFLLIFQMRPRCFRRAVALDREKTAPRRERARTTRKTTGPMSHLSSFLRSWVGSPKNLAKYRQRHWCKGTWKAFWHRPKLHGFSMCVVSQLHTKPQWSYLQGFSLRIHKASKVPASVKGCFTTAAAMFGDQKKHLRSMDETKCKHCGAADSQNHRRFDCPLFAGARREIPIQDLQACQTYNGPKKPFSQTASNTRLGRLASGDAASALC